MVIPLDQLFASTSLTVYVPESSLKFSSTESWLNSIKSGTQERRQAFFGEQRVVMRRKKLKISDEQLRSLLFLQIKHPEEPFKAADDPPDSVINLLRHVQVTLEATYISPIPNSPAETPRTSRLLATPRTGALALPKPIRSTRMHPSILPPSTPNPTPTTGDHDRKYTTSEGTLLLAQIWGTNSADDSPEEFTLLWSDDDSCWIAVYHMAFTVCKHYRFTLWHFLTTTAFIRLNFNDPLICLTVSATLREKPLPTTSKHPLQRFFCQKSTIFSSLSDSSIKGEAPKVDDSNLLDGLEEVNLLEGLSAGPTFGKMYPNLNLPSIRLGTESRQRLFSLPPVVANSPIRPSPSPMTAVRKAHPTLRKSYRKTLQTASGFRVRMRTVFVPFVILPETDGNIEDLEEEKKQLARQEAGSAERTVVLCVEIENFGDMGQNAGFLVENVEVSIAGEGAKATLIVWGNEGFTPDAARDIFPLKIGRSAQYNLLYAVSFLRSPEEVDAFSFAQTPRNPSANNMHRAVTINVIGKPYFPTSPSSQTLIPDPNDVTFPTQSFSSRWNCVLDLSSQHPSLSDLFDPIDQAIPNVLPQPASPFPSYSAYSGTPRQPYSATPLFTSYSATAVNKKLTLVADANIGARTLKSLTPTKSLYLKPSDNSRDETPLGSSRPISHVGNVTPDVGPHYLTSTTTYSAPPPAPTMISNQVNDGQYAGPSAMNTPTTPAFPPFPPKSELPQTPTTLGPVSSSQGNMDQSVEIKRARASVVDPLSAPPISVVPGAKSPESCTSGENIVVSVGLLPFPRPNHKDHEAYLGQGKIYPLQVFTLDIFVLNQSSWVRRFEITCPERRRRKRGGSEMGVFDGGSEATRRMGYPGILPLESRVRIGSVF